MSSVICLLVLFLALLKYAQALPKIVEATEKIMAQGQTMARGFLTEIDGKTMALTYNRLLFDKDSALFRGESENKNTLLVTKRDGKWYISEFNSFQFAPDPYQAR